MKERFRITRRGEDGARIEEWFDSYIEALTRFDRLANPSSKDERSRLQLHVLTLIEEA